MRHLWEIVIIVFICSSCGTMRLNKTYDFAKINDVKDLNGHYLDRINNNSILYSFDITGEYADFVTITSEKANEIKLIYYNDTARQERIINGQMKKNYFEVYFSKRQFIIPLIYSSCDIVRIRVGKSKDGKLLIREFLNQSANLLFLSRGHSFETPYRFYYSTEYKGYIPIQENGLWGYSNSLGDIVIPAKYDFASIFENNVARVKLDEKWGLINIQGEEITPFKYDFIEPIDTLDLPAIFRVFIGEKTGALDINGNETIPVIYDAMGAFSDMNNPNQDKLTLIQIGDKFGYANRSQVIIPALYSYIGRFIGSYSLVERDGIYYMIDREWYEYETKGIGKNRKPKLETKRKIQFEEQIIE